MVEIKVEPKINTEKKYYLHLPIFTDMDTYKIYCYTCGLKELKSGTKEGICNRCWKIIDEYAYREMLKVELLGKK